MDIRIALNILLTVVPFVILLRYYYRRDLFREPRRALVRTFLLGLAITVPAVHVEIGLSAIPLGAAGPLTTALFSAFVTAAIPEEALKLLVLRGYCARQASFDEPMDGIVYGATAALGFAALENILYVADGGLVTAAVRSVTSVPMHATWGAVLGYYVARAQRGGKRSDIWRGLAIAVAAHGLFDFVLMGAALLAAERGEEPGAGLAVLGLLIAFVVTVAVSWIAVLRLIRRLHREQVARLMEERAAAAAGCTPLPWADAPRAAHVVREERASGGRAAALDPVGRDGTPPAK